MRQVRVRLRRLATRPKTGGAFAFASCTASRHILPLLPIPSEFRRASRGSWSNPRPASHTTPSYTCHAMETLSGAEEMRAGSGQRPRWTRVVSALIFAPGPRPIAVAPPRLAES